MKLPTRESLDLRTKRIIVAILLVLTATFVTVIGYTVGVPLVKFVTKPVLFRKWVEDKGMISRFAFIGMVIFQVVIALVPGEPFEIGAGYAFGTFEGTALCLFGSLIGSLIIFILVRTIGVKVVEVFFSIDKIRSLKFMTNPKKLNIITFTVFLIPGTPKDLLSYFVGLTEIKLSSWLFISTIARIPSIITSTAGGDALGLGNYNMALIFFVVAAIISISGFLIYKKLFEKQ